MIFSVWKLGAPKERIIALVDKLDADSDGYVTFEEVRDLLKDYAKAVRRSARFGKRR